MASACDRFIGTDDVLKVSTVLGVTSAGSQQGDEYYILLRLKGSADLC